MEKTYRWIHDEMLAPCRKPPQLCIAGFGCLTRSSSVSRKLNPTVGDIAEPCEDSRARAQCGERCDVLVCSELALIGYPPEDLVLRPAVLAATRRAVEDLAGDTVSGPAVFVTTPWQENGVVYNAAVLLTEGRVGAIRFKHDLPNYGVFDEKRVFASGPLPEPVEFHGVRLGLMICEDMWYPKVASHLASRGAELLLVPNGSPFERSKFERHHAGDRRAWISLGLAYVNRLAARMTGLRWRLLRRQPINRSWSAAGMKEIVCTTEWARGASVVVHVPNWSRSHPNRATPPGLMLRRGREQEPVPGVLLGLSEASTPRSRQWPSMRSADACSACGCRRVSRAATARPMQMCRRSGWACGSKPYRLRAWWTPSSGARAAV